MRKLSPFLPIIHQILAVDPQSPKKQRHTAKRIFERLRDEHGYQGGKTVVKDAVRAWEQSHQEVFLPLSRPPGEAQVDFGEATTRLAGQETKVALFVMTLPCSGAIFMQAFPREYTQTYLEDHRRAFEFCGGVATQQIRELPTELSPQGRWRSRIIGFQPTRRRLTAGKKGHHVPIGML